MKTETKNQNRPSRSDRDRKRSRAARELTIRRKLERAAKQYTQATTAAPVGGRI